MGKDTANKSMRTMPKALLIFFLVAGFAFLVYEKTRTVLDKADRAYRAEKVDQALDLYKEAVEAGFDVKDSETCLHQKTRLDSWDCYHLKDMVEEKIWETLSYPKVTNHIWNVNGVDISPRCLEEEWTSSDNYQEYEEQYSKAENFSGYSGQYWGSLIPIEPINASWGKPLSLPKSLDLCNKIRPAESISVEKNVSSFSVPEKHESTEVGYYNKAYTLIAEWGAKECSKLVPHFAGNCQSLVFVKLDNSYKYPDVQRNTYAYVMDKERAYIVPVTHEMYLKDVLKLIENN